MHHNSTLTQVNLSNLKLADSSIKFISHKELHVNVTIFIALYQQRNLLLCEGSQSESHIPPLTE